MVLVLEMFQLQVLGSGQHKRVLCPLRTPAAKGNRDQGISAKL